MIEIVTDLPFEDCEKCNLFYPGLKYWKFAKDMCNTNKVIIFCHKSETCENVRRHIKNLVGGYTDGADK